MKNYNLTLLCLSLVISCKPSQQVGACVQTTGDTGLFEVHEGTIAEALLEDEVSPTGILRIRYADSLLNHAESLGAAVENTSTTSCTGVVKVDSIEEDGSVLGKLITARHCIVSAYADYFEMNVNGVTLVSGNDENAKNWIKDDLGYQVIIDEIDTFRHIRSFLSLEGQDVNDLTNLYGTYDDLSNLRMTIPELRNDASEGVYDSMMSNKKERRSILLNLSMISRHESQEKAAFGHPMCKGGPREFGETDDYGSDQNMFCFLPADLGVYNFKVLNPEKNKKRTVNIAGKRMDKHSVLQDLFGKIQERVDSKSFGSEERIAKLNGGVGALYELKMRSLGFALQTELPENPKMKSAITETWKSVNDHIGANASSSLQGDLRSYAQGVAMFMDWWNPLIARARDSFGSDFQLLTTNQVEGSTDDLKVGKAILRNMDITFVVRSYGLVGFSRRESLSFTKGDSGSLLTVGGTIPIAVLSRVNGDDTSGGVASNIPDKIPDDLKTKPFPDDPEDEDGAGKGGLGNDGNGNGNPGEVGTGTNPGSVGQGTEPKPDPGNAGQGTEPKADPGDAGQGTEPLPPPVGQPREPAPRVEPVFVPPLPPYDPWVGTEEPPSQRDPIDSDYFPGKTVEPRDEKAGGSDDLGRGSTGQRVEIEKEVAAGGVDERSVGSIDCQ